MTQEQMLDYLMSEPKLILDEALDRLDRVCAYMTDAQYAEVLANWIARIQKAMPER